MSLVLGLALSGAACGSDGRDAGDTGAAVDGAAAADVDSAEANDSAEAVDLFEDNDTAVDTLIEDIATDTIPPGCPAGGSPAEGCPCVSARS